MKTYSAIREAIAKPIAPCRPSLPNLLVVSRRLQLHITRARTFLDSLPEPFTWRFETEEEAEAVSSGVHNMNEENVAKGLKIGAGAKATANAAYAKQNCAVALKAYSEAIRTYEHVLTQRPDTAEEKTALRQLAVCYANRAAAYLLPGQGLDHEAALKDARKAEEVDPTYEKG